VRLAIVYSIVKELVVSTISDDNYASSTITCAAAPKSRRRRTIGDFFPSA